MVSLHDKNLSKKSPTPKSHECFSLNEVRKKLNVEYSKNRRQLLQHAGWYCKKLKKTEPEDLINETYKRFLEGTRKWKKCSNFFQTFKEAMRSIAGQEYINEKKTVSESSIKNDKEYSIYEHTPDQTQNQEEEIIYRQEQEGFKKILKNLLIDDSLAQDLLNLHLKGYTRKGIMEKLEINDREYNTVYKKIFRRITKSVGLK